MRELPLVLQLDMNGNPQCWIDYEKAAYYYTKDLIAWVPQPEDFPEPENFTLYGGTNRASGNQSTLTMETIIAVRGKVTGRQVSIMNKVPLTNKTLFRRDQHLCAYCGQEYTPRELSREHIIPESKGGPDIWMNVVTACYSCNKLKDDRTPEEAHMPLLYLPYIPNRAEYLILQNRKILADQMEFLMARVPKESRLLAG